MALDTYNSKLQRVSINKEEEFKKYVVPLGEIHFRQAKKSVSLGDGVKKGGHNLASKQQVLDAIRYVEVNDKYDEIEVD